jgi:hypothetical protein
MKIAGVWNCSLVMCSRMLVVEWNVDSESSCTVFIL